MMRLPVDEWATLEGELGAHIPVFDFLWWARCNVEFDNKTEFADQSGAWEQVYCEMRVENIICAGVENVDQVPCLSLWRSVF